MTKFSVWALLLAMVFASGYWFGMRSGSSLTDSQNSKATVAVKRGDLQVSIAEMGVLKAKDFTRITSGIRQAVKISYLIAEGTRVKKGDVLVRFDSSDILREIKNTRQKILAARAKYKATQGEKEITRIENENKIAQAKLSCQEAQKNLEKYIQGELPLALQEKQINLQIANASLERLRKKIKQMPKLLKQGFVTKDQVKAKEIELKEQKIKYDKAKNELKLFVKYTKPLEIQKKQAEVTKNKAELQSQQKQMQAKLKQKQTEIDSKKLEIENQEAQLKKLQEKLKKMTLTAPTDGLVIYGEPGYWRDLDIRVGMEVSDHTPIITLPNFTQMQVALRIHEVDIQHIKLHMPVVVTIESAGNMVVSGKISKIAELANSGGWLSDPEVKQFDVDISIDKKNLPLKPGTTAKVEIVIQRLKQTLYVPVQAIHAVKSKRYCYIKEGKNIKRQQVILSLSNDKYVAIQSGLNEKQQVYLSLPDVLKKQPLQNSLGSINEKAP